MSGKVIERQAFGLTSNATDFSPTINNWKPMSRRFFRSIANAAQIASLQDSVRYALNCLELHGEFRSIAATDGKQLYVADRISLPWSVRRLIPALPILRSNWIHSVEQGELGCDEQWVGMRFGQCRLKGLRTEKAEVYIRQNPTYRYPNIRQLLPDTSKPATCLTLEPSDSRRLRSLLEQVGSQASRACQLVRMHCGDAFTVRMLSPSGFEEVAFPHSRVSGPELVVTVSRNHLFTALRIGLRRFRLESALEPVVASDNNQRFIWLPTREPLSGSMPETVTGQGTATKVGAKRPDSNLRSAENCSLTT